MFPIVVVQFPGIKCNFNRKGAIKFHNDLNGNESSFRGPLIVWQGFVSLASMCVATFSATARAHTETPLARPSIFVVVDSRVQIVDQVAVQVIPFPLTKKSLLSTQRKEVELEVPLLEESQLTRIASDHKRNE